MIRWMLSGTPYFIHSLHNVRVVCTFPYMLQGALSQLTKRVDIEPGALAGALRRYTQRELGYTSPIAELSPFRISAHDTTQCHRVHEIRAVHVNIEWLQCCQVGVGSRQYCPAPACGLSVELFTRGDEDACRRGFRGNQQR
eukprot:TRINITY_DN61354_c0_g1_i1.p2 TRINITY_DN61354_c0_g1~~TRINITY_DN61354_c0_g1_i1.p2  ORF type:complete len:141 (+),score=1.34 TRINITY_DN61354_c0_g1_i1:7-429(+)